MKILYLDMDGVLADFRAGVGRPNAEWNPPEMYVKGFFRDLPLMAGAKDAVAELLKHNYLDVYIASKPTHDNLWCATEKYQWLEEHFPMLLKKTFLACDKGHLNGDYLIDDDLKQWGPKFKGTLLHFDEYKPVESWNRILPYLAKYR